MIDRKLDELLQEQFVYDAPSKLKYNQLSEAQKMNLTKNLVDSTLNLVMRKANSLDYSLVEATKGSIRKLEGYSDLVGAIDTLKALQSMGNRNIEGVAVVDAALTNLKNFEAHFNRAFALNCTMVELVYNNITVALIASTAYLVSTAVDLIKMDSGLINVTVNPRSVKGLDTAMLKSLDKFNKMCMNGEMTRFINRALPELRQGIGGVGLLLLGVAGFGFLLVTVLIMIRQIVYQYYNTRVKVADYMRTNATFLELNQNKLAMANNMQSVAKKQQDAANRLIQLADKIDIDQKVSTKKSNLELKDDLNQAGDMNSVADDDDLLF